MLSGFTQPERSAADSATDVDSFVFKTDRPWPNARLKVAAIVGHTTSTSVRMWFRTGRPACFAAFVFPQSAALARATSETALRASLARAPILAADLEAMLPAGRRGDFEIRDYEADTTFVLDLDGLDPDTRYGYVLYDRHRRRVVLGHNRLRAFRTPPAETGRRPFQFALLSCHMPYAVEGLFQKRTEVVGLDMWDFLGATLDRHASDVDLVLAGGDQCYTDGVPTLDIWRHLNRTMRREDGALRPDEEAMLSWYRDIYRGYWGFASVQRVFDAFPTYMIWDDHEIGDGWGSHDLDRDGARRLLPDLAERGLDEDDGRELAQRMFRAATRAYVEYQHAHNPPSREGVFDYGMRRGGCAFYVLDGRGHRDLSRADHRILGREQFERFSRWIEALSIEETPFAFVVSAVPVVHTRTALVNADDLAVLRARGLDDDLRDSWEHTLHDAERRALMAALFSAAARGIRVAILSGDVHVSAVFALEDGSGNRIHQLTSSAVTYQLSRVQSWVLGAGAADEGRTDDGYSFQRLALFAESSYALVSVDPARCEAWFKLYGRQRMTPPVGAGADSVPLSHSLAKIRLC